MAPIPHPPTYPLVGNVLSVDPDDPMLSIVNLMKQYGPIISLKFPKRPRPVLMVGCQEYVHELCDQERFQKVVGGALEEVRAIAKDGEHLPPLQSIVARNRLADTRPGLFTAHQHEEAWAIAHRILIPSFGPLSIRGMFPNMFDIASQLIMKACSVLLLLCE